LIISCPEDVSFEVFTVVVFKIVDFCVVTIYILWVHIYISEKDIVSILSVQL
jgi:hypothetical protein